MAYSLQIPEGFVWCITTAGTQLNENTVWYRPISDELDLTDYDRELLAAMLILP